MAESLHSVLRDAEDQLFFFKFQDGEEMLAEVVSATHVDLDDTVAILRIGASPTEPAYNVHLADIRSLNGPDGRVVYERT